MNIALLFVLAATAAVVFATTGVWLGRHFMRGRVDKGHHEVLATLFQTGGTLHAVFLAFLVVAVWESYNAAHANVADEASALTTLYRESAGMESGMGKELRRLIRDYTDAVVRDEWRIQAETGGASPKARAAGLAIISQIQSDRNRRTLAAEASLPPIMWFAAIGSGAIVLSMSFFLFMEQAAPQMIVTSIMTSTVALLLCIAFVLSHPFAGPMALNPEPFKHAIEVYDSVDATP